MDLRRRSKNYVVEAIADEALLAIGQESARPNCGLDVDRMDSVAEGCNESVEPRLQCFSAFRIAATNSFDGGLELDEGGCREEQGILVSLDPASEGGSFWPSRRQAFEQGCSRLASPAVIAEPARSRAQGQTERPIGIV